ncbi:MAG: ATP-binding protein [Gammaproteobacteria bacterium]|nr:ATP-binding protein [Gammaproteobacteria bacterium]
MMNVKLIALTIENFKSFKDPARIELAPLTILLGRNNAGKSSLIQSLLLLKQTLNGPRSDVMLRLEGIVDAFNLRELTFGWPASSQRAEGFAITLEWECSVNFYDEYEKAGSPEPANLVKFSKLDGLYDLSSRQHYDSIKTSMTIRTAEINGVASVSEIKIQSLHKTLKPAVIEIRPQENTWACFWQGKQAAAKHIKIEFDRFIPYLRINRSAIGPRHSQRAIN